jgi:transcriptional regulator of arginine metabolism
MKSQRQFTIKELISAKSVGSQDELRLELKKKGFKVTQATLSRDLQELGVARLPSDDGFRYALQPETGSKILRPAVTTEIITISGNESMIVVRTLPGCANVVGEVVDTLRNPDIIGTVAGDNTLLIIPSSTKKTKKVIEFLKDNLVKGKP